MATYDVVMFDLDGTLTDPKIGITKSVQYALSKFNIFEDNLDNLEDLRVLINGDKERRFFNHDRPQPDSEENR